MVWRAKNVPGTWFGGSLAQMSAGATRMETKMSDLTKPEKAEKLKELGWIRISSGGAQSWRHPILNGTFTLAAAWQQAERRKS
jgi:hypothetical protein